jgi:Tol biopolymer transport system component
MQQATGPSGPAGDRLSIVAPDHSTRSVPIRVSTLTVGRGSGNGLVLDHPKVSRRHARIDFDGTNYRVTDLNSTNGTFLGDVRLQPGVPTLWVPWQPLRIGDHLLRLERGTVGPQRAIPGERPPASPARTVQAAVPPPAAREPARRRRLVPLWVLPLVLLLGIALTAAVILSLKPREDSIANQTPTAAMTQTMPGSVESPTVAETPTPLPAGATSSTPTETPSQQPTSTFTPTYTPSPTPTGTPTPTGSPTPTNTATPTLTPTPTETATPIPIGGGTGRIAFWSVRDGSYESYSMNVDGSGLTRLTDNPAVDESPTWSPDGRRIAFSSTRDGNRNIHVMDAEGGNVMALTQGDVRGFDPDWCQDGTIAFMTDGSMGTGIAAMNEAGGQQRLILEGYLRQPAWSPDGSRIAFVCLFGDMPEICVANRDGTSMTYLTSGPDEYWSPAWSPDGQKIAFSSLRAGNSEIYVMNADGSGVVRLTFDEGADGEPAWSPDGEWIAFVSWRDGNAEIYLMRADGSGQTRLTDNPALDGSPAWQPAIST